MGLVKAVTSPTDWSGQAGSPAPSSSGSHERSIVAGIGFRRAAGADEIVALVGHAFGKASLAPERLRAVATASDRAQDIAFQNAAATLGVVAIGLDAEALAGVDGAVPTRSARIEALRGVGSLAEAAALAGAGPGARLLRPRIASASVTCALALAPERP